MKKNILYTYQNYDLIGNKKIFSAGLTALKNFLEKLYFNFFIKEIILYKNPHNYGVIIKNFEDYKIFKIKGYKSF